MSYLSMNTNIFSNKMENKMDDLYYYLKSLILVPQKDNNVMFDYLYDEYLCENCENMNNIKIKNYIKKQRRRTKKTIYY